MTTSLTWLGHAALLVETGGYRLLVDPFLTGNPAASMAAADAPADYILISHGHGDHVGDTVSIAQRTGATVIGNAEIAGWAQKKGLKAHGQHLGGGFIYPFGYLKLTMALHGSALPDGTNGGNPAGFLLTTTDGLKIYLAGDTGLFGDMQLIGARPPAHCADPTCATSCCRERRSTGRANSSPPRSSPRRPTPYSPPSSAWGCPPATSR
jgi:L-ascorbate metabolism protein UlaG (beta-lactamase superfamily)